MIQPILRDALFLKRKSTPATAADLPCARDLADTLLSHKSDCVGMAANMIGVSRRIVAVFIGPTVVLFYNPVILRREGAYTAEEGCLSLPGTRKVTRYHTIELEYQDESFRTHRQVYREWIAQVLQHEIDHLEGVLI